MRAELPDLPEIMAAGFGLTEALRIWGEFQNTPSITYSECLESLAKRPPTSPAFREEERAVLGSDAPNVIQFSPARER